MKSSQTVPATVNPMEVATEAAKKAGAVCPEGVADFLKDKLSVVETAAGPTVMVKNGLGFEPLDFVMTRMQITEGVGALFNGGTVNVKNLDHDTYLVLRKHRPEIFGLRRKQW